MVVTRLEELEQSKIKVSIDEEYAFIIYKKDNKRFKLEEGMEITSELYEDIIEDTVYRRAKQKALAILKFMDRSEQELRKKLSEAGYTVYIINRVIEYLYGYNYLSDERVASAYFHAKMNTKSKLMIRNELLHKGISSELIEQLFATEYSPDNGADKEIIAIKKAIGKKTKAPGDLSFEEKQKLMASLYRKGFDITKIKQLLS